ncbi:MMPL family transporter [Streptomyces sp. NPDC091279]|uniref:MMPL family transporter n=1 Tax=Streptomyces sp. NPDC091279 TaxID=3365983 RepID=UPI0037F3DC96
MSTASGGAVGQVGAGGQGGRIDWQADDGRVTDDAVRADMTSTLETVADAPGVAAVVSPYTDAGAQQISEDASTAYATVTFDATADDARIETVRTLALAESSGSLRIALNGQAFTATPASNPATEDLGTVPAFLILLLVFRAVWMAALPIITAVAGVGTAALTVMLSPRLTSRSGLPAPGAPTGRRGRRLGRGVGRRVWRAGGRCGS